MPDEPTEPTIEGGLSRESKTRIRRLNEHLRLVSAMLDRLGTVIIGGAVLAPLFQHQQPRLRETAAWIGVAVAVHATAHLMLYLTAEEE